MKTDFSTLTFELLLFELLRSLIKDRGPIFFGNIQVNLISLDVLDSIVILLLRFIVNTDIEF